MTVRLPAVLSMDLEACKFERFVSCNGRVLNRRPTRRRADDTVATYQLILPPFFIAANV